jgi:hypothetical protein
MDYDETRDTERIAILGELHGEVMVFQPTTIREISRGGAQVETLFPLHVDSLHEFRLSLGDRSVVVKGRIAHCQICELREGTIRYRNGIEFIEPTEHALAAIHAFVEAIKFAATAPPAIVEAELAEE